MIVFNQKAGSLKVAVAVEFCKAVATKDLQVFI